MKTKNIHIGEDKYIQWIDFNPKEKEILNIDVIPETSWIFGNYWKQNV